MAYQVKALSVKFDYLTSSSKTHEVEEDSWVSQIATQLPYVCPNTNTQTHPYPHHPK